MLSREEDELRELLDLLENAFLTFSFARVIMMPAKRIARAIPEGNKKLRGGLALVVSH
jgi:hypothetical protein